MVGVIVVNTKSTKGSRLSVGTKSVAEPNVSRACPIRVIFPK